MATKQQTFGERVRADREAAGLSRYKLAQIIGATPSAIELWEMKGTEPKLRYVQACSRLFGWSMEDVLAFDWTTRVDLNGEAFGAAA